MGGLCYGLFYNKFCPLWGTHPIPKPLVRRTLFVISYLHFFWWTLDKKVGINNKKTPELKLVQKAFGRHFNSTIIAVPVDQQGAKAYCWCLICSAPRAVVYIYLYYWSAHTACGLMWLFVRRIYILLKRWLFLLSLCAVYPLHCDKSVHLFFHLVGILTGTFCRTIERKRWAKLVVCFFHNGERTRGSGSEDQGWGHQLLVCSTQYVFFF